VLMGMAPGTSEKELASAAPGLNRADIQTPSLGDIAGPAQLMRRRPDVIAAERQLAASNARIGQALAQYYPQLSLSGLLGFESLASGQLFTAAAFQPQAVLGLHWRLFDFGRVDAQVVQARGANAQALAQYKLAMLRATQDVENAIVTLVQLQQQRQHVDRQVTAHRVARAAAEAAYGAGVAPLIEVLGEDRQLLVARDQQAQLQAQDARSVVAAFRALGGGWQGGGWDAAH
jgi:outer membrane protein TolC